MKKQRIVFLIMTVLLLLMTVNRISSANIRAAAKSSFLPQTHSKHFSSTFGKTNDQSSADDDLISTDYPDDDFNFSADSFSTDFSFAGNLVISTLLFLLFLKLKKDESTSLSPFIITIKKYLLIRSIRI